MENYRPISILTVVSKIMERGIQNQLLQYLERTDKPSLFQCGFRGNHTTQDAITYLKDCIRRGIDKGSLTAAVFIDLQKAFDSVDHKLLLTKK